MNQKYYAIGLFLFGLISVARGAELPPAEEFIKLAARSRADFIFQVGELQRVAPTFDSSEKVFPYLNLIDALKKLEKDLDVATFGGGPMRGLSATLTKAAVKFIAYDRSEDPAFANFMNAADDLTRLAAIENQYRALASVEEKERLLKFYEGSQVTIRLLESKEKIEAYVLNAADGLQGTIVKSLIPFAKQLKPKEMETILRQTVGVTAITEVSHFLRGRLADEDGPVEIREIFHFGLILSDNTKHSKSIVPEYVKSLVGENLVECVKRLLSKGDSLTAEEVKGLPLLLEISELKGLSMTLMEIYERKRIPPNQMAALAPLVKMMAPILDKYGFEEDARKLRGFGQRILVAQLLDQHDYEGTYRFQVGKEQGWLTVADSGESNFIMSLRLPTKTSNVTRQYNFFFVGFDMKRQRWQAHRVDVASINFKYNPTAQWMLDFDFDFEPGDQSLRLKGTFFDRKEFRPFTAVKVQPFGKYLDPLPANEKGPSFLMGSYWTRAKTFGVSLTQVDQHTQLYLHYPVGVPPETFNFVYYDERTGSIYATSAEPDDGNGHWLQVRGKVTKGGQSFCGEYIVGGVGKQFDFCTTLAN